MVVVRKLTLERDEAEVGRVVLTEHETTTTLPPSQPIFIFILGPEDVDVASCSSSLSLNWRLSLVSRIYFQAPLPVAPEAAGW